MMWGKDFTYPEIVKRLKTFGFRFDRHAAGGHELWYNEKTKRYTTVQDSPRVIPERVLAEILKQAGITPLEFIQYTN